MNTPDPRYTVARDGHGQYIAKFCRHVIGTYASQRAAVTALWDYHTDRLEYVA